MPVVADTKAQGHCDYLPRECDSQCHFEHAHLVLGLMQKAGKTRSPYRHRVEHRREPVWEVWRVVVVLKPVFPPDLVDHGCELDHERNNLAEKGSVVHPVMFMANPQYRRAVPFLQVLNM